MKISIASDHAGFEYKTLISAFLKSEGMDITDHGTYNTDSCDYPDFAHALAESVGSKNTLFGILICGSGNGVCMTANKHPHVRAALAWNDEIAELARRHNDANVICLPARYISEELAKSIVWHFLHAGFEGGRHKNRVEKIAERVKATSSSNS